MLIEGIIPIILSLKRLEGHLSFSHMSGHYKRTSEYAYFAPTSLTRPCLTAPGRAGLALGPGLGGEKAPLFTAVQPQTHRGVYIPRCLPVHLYSLSSVGKHHPPHFTCAHPCIWTGCIQPCRVWVRRGGYALHGALPATTPAGGKL